MSDKIVILDSAKKSARNAADFQNPHRLLNALWKLSDEYLPAYLAGGGDNKTKNIFGTEIYAANESEQTMNNPRCKTARTFAYKGQEIVIWRHLGWGKAQSTRETLCLHFYVDQNDKKIVIGHYGEHLPTIKTSSI